MGTDQHDRCQEAFRRGGWALGEQTSAALEQLLVLRDRLGRKLSFKEIEDDYTDFKAKTLDLDRYVASVFCWAFRSRRPSQTFWDSSFIKVEEKVQSVVVNAVQELSTEKQWKTDITNKENMMEATRKPKVYESSEALQQRYATDGMMSRNSFANICDAQFQYFYEYLGNIPWQIITPLTDRCSITPTQALHLAVSGVTAEAAGTEKTETMEDLGCALGMMVKIFNYSEYMDDETVNTEPVISSSKVPLKLFVNERLDGNTKSSVFVFLGENTTLKSRVGIFITMIPGCAGQTELNEKTCAMVVPDIELVSGMMLAAEGFIDACLLARKFITFQPLCRELLPEQLMCILRDFNLHKIVTDDIPIFTGVISDLFPSLDVLRMGNLQSEQMVKQSTLELYLQPEENFILKHIDDGHWWPPFNSPGPVSSGEPERVLDNAVKREACPLILDYGIFCYDRQKATIKEINNFQYVAFMNLAAGSFIIKPKFHLGGYELLIGVGGKQSLSGLAGYICSLEVFQITQKKSGPQDLAKTGAKNMPTVFLLTDAQVPDECFLVLINDLLASGEAPDLFCDEDMKVTTAAVDLKSKLATQEAELQLKNQGTEALIAKIGFQTEKLSQVKAIADAEELKVDDSWQDLINYDKEHISQHCLKVAKHYLKDPHFKLNYVHTESFSAAGLCSWAINKVKISEVYFEREPKYCAVAQANTELAAAVEKLEVIRESFFIMQCGPLAYATCSNWFMSGFLKKAWTQFITLRDNATAVAWSKEWDRMSTENTTVLTNCECPLMIDPQQQGIKCVKNKYGADLKVFDQQTPAYAPHVHVQHSRLYKLKTCDSIDPILDPLLGRHTIKKGRCTKIEDKKCEFKKNFHLILHTKLVNPHYKPQLQAQTTFINFTVTRGRLEDQLLAELSSSKPWTNSLSNTLCHPDFCVFISAKPAPTTKKYIIPQGALENSIEMTGEPPTRMLANFHAALHGFDQGTSDLHAREGKFKSICFPLCNFHTSVPGRLKFGPWGWNGSLEGNLAPCFLASPNLDYDGYHKYIDEMLPSESPVLYGLHPSAEMGFFSTSDNLFNSHLEKQAISPWERDQFQSEPEAREALSGEIRHLKVEESERVDLLGLLLNLLYCVEEVKKVLGDILEMLPEKLNIAEIMQEDYCLEILCSGLPQRVSITDLLMRHQGLDIWTQDLLLPAVVRLSGLFHPQCFLTGQQ
ncbi:LOW QUALITY PROTEIN: dynein axonemal heavy chain 11 [Passerculus sandwichensis]